MLFCIILQVVGMSERSLYRDMQPGILGIIAGLSSFNESCSGANLTDKLSLAGVMLIFPEFSEISEDVFNLITLGNQIDHYFYSLLENTEDLVFQKKSALINFNLLRKSRS